jgi:hemerythrin
MSNLEKTKRLIKEGHTTVHENLMDAMVSIKKSNPKLSHVEVMSILQDEFSKFIKRHSDREDISKFSLEEPIRNKPFRDTIPLRSIPYGDKRKKGL